MSLKTMLTKEEFATLSPGLREAYVANGDGYKLNIEGFVVDKDPAALLNAKEHEKKARQEAELELQRLKQTIAEHEENLRKAKEAADLEKMKKSGDFEALTKSFEAKIAAIKEEQTARERRVKEAMAKVELEKTAADIASKLALNPDMATILRPHIMSRLGYDIDGDLPKIRVIDAEGKPSAETFEDLQKSFLARKEFSAILVGTKASGVSGPTNGGSKVSTAGKKFADFLGSELVQLRKENPAEYDRLKTEHYSTSQKP